MARAAAAAIEDKKGDSVTLLDVSDLIQITDVFVIASGSSNRHVRTLADAVEERLREMGRKPYRREGLSEARWVLLDYGDVVVHLFQPDDRRLYDLERLWGDAEPMEHRRATQP